MSYKLKTSFVFPSSGGTSDYEDLENKPKINNVELKGNKTLDDLGIQAKGSYVSDANYVHTDNNYTSAEKTKLAGLENYNDTQVKSDISSLNTNKADKSEIPDTSNFITKAVNDLTNYYVKSDTYTKSEVNTLIGNIVTIHLEVVEELPATGEENVIYLILKEDEQDNNIYNEYVYVNGSYELIGTTDIDLSDYALKSEIPTNLSELENDTNYISEIPSDYVTFENTTEYTPSNDYAPASKKYVDDLVGNIDELLIDLDEGSGV